MKNRKLRRFVLVAMPLMALNIFAFLTTIVIAAIVGAVPAHGASPLWVNVWGLAALLPLIITVVVAGSVLAIQIIKEKW